VTSARLSGHTRHDIAQALATSPGQGRLLLTYEITGLLLRVDAAVEQFAIGMPQADPVSTKNGG
jgi:hypothetical protein